MIVGYGRMGKMIEEKAIGRGHSISTRVDNGGYGDSKDITPELLSKTDIVIDFALADGIKDRIELYINSKVPAVLGTTGCNDIIKEYKEMTQSSGATILWGSNYSTGAHILFHFAQKAAELINRAPEYDIFTTEYHHKMKKDSPSGTAITIAERIISANDKKTTINSARIDRQINEDELHVASVRGGYIPGTHIVTLDSPADSVTLTHTARDRSGFALGAVEAAEWVVNKTGFYNVEEYIKDKFQF